MVACKHGEIAIVNIEIFWLFRQFIKNFQHNQQYDTFILPVTPCMHKLKLELPIDLDYGTVWTHVGYIASELCEYLHPLIAAGDVVDVTDVFVQCIKYRVDFFY